MGESVHQEKLRAAVPSSVTAKDGDADPSDTAGIGTINHDYTHITNG